MQKFNGAKHTRNIKFALMSFTIIYTNARESLKAKILFPLTTIVFKVKLKTLPVSITTLPFSWGYWHFYTKKCVIRHNLCFCNVIFDTNGPSKLHLRNRRSSWKQSITSQLENCWGLSFLTILISEFYWCNRANMSQIGEIITSSIWKFLMKKCITCPYVVLYFSFKLGLVREHLILYNEFKARKRLG